MMAFHTTNPSLFFSKNDRADIRLGEICQRIDYSGGLVELKDVLKSHDKQKQHYYLAGYPDDKGIELNGGRVGAREAPDTIRKFLYKMTPSAQSESHSFYDIGNLETSKELEERHDTARRFVKACLENSGNFIGLGGGHDYAYPDGAGFLQHLEDSKNKKRPVVLNFDAHLDVRPSDRGLSSGTPFFRLIKDFPDQFDFYEIGIQSHCNSPNHIQWAKDHNVKILNFEKLNRSGKSLVESIQKKFSKKDEGRPCYLSIDIDGFSSAFAMGCSQSWATGLTPNDFFPCLAWLREFFDIRVLGIYEVSPPLDLDDRTSKLAAQIIYSYLNF